jgi:hypothetical protein
MRSRDVKAVIIAALRAGARQVEVKVGTGSVVIPLVPDDDKPVEASEWLEGDDAH